jgi:hypothetical protein
MKQFLFLFVAFIFATTLIFAQDKKGCKFITVKLTNGTQLQMIKVSSKIGYFLIGKTDGKIAVSYNTNAFMNAFAPQDNMLSLKVDSIKFMFSDNSFLVLKPVLGIGQALNSSLSLKPIMRNLNFTINYSTGSKEDQAFRQKTLRLFGIFAEKEAQYGDSLNEKQQAQFASAFDCLP